MDNNRFDKGSKKMSEIGGEVGNVVTPLGDLGKYIVEFIFGDIYSREGLSLREIVTIAILAIK